MAHVNPPSHTLTTSSSSSSSSSSPHNDQSSPSPQKPLASSPTSMPRRVSAPLFDPHGLSASALDEQQPLIERQNVVASTSMTKGSDSGFVRRGRRRKSSEKVVVVEKDASHNANSDTAAEVELDDNGCLNPKTSARLWWQRETEGESSAQASASASSSTVLERPKPHLETQSLYSVPRSRQMSNGTDGTSRSPSVRSPAAAFLSSMNDMLASTPTSSSFVSQSGDHTWASSQRNYSISPPRSAAERAVEQTHHRTASVDGMNANAGHYAMGSAAAHLYSSADHQSNISSSHSYVARPDEQGARFGPKGRYLLGRMIGFGGFSTIREAWDLGEDRAASVNLAEINDGSNWHRLAVKIVYTEEEDGKTKGQEQDEEQTNELEFWRSIPAHPNILPLLYHERMRLEETIAVHSSGPVVNASVIDFLVMPFCQGNLLTFVRSSGAALTENSSAPSSRSGSIVAPASGPRMARTASMRTDRYTGEIVGSLESARSQISRTGSGFVPHARWASVSGDRIVSAPLSSLIGQPGAPIRRTGSVRARAVAAAQAQNNRGVPIGVACDVMRQLTEAMLCLHHKAAILHGDLKLENVLGQQWQVKENAAPLHGLSPLSGNSGPDKNDEHSSSQELVDELNSKATVSAICWRVADFGLARKIASKTEQNIETNGHRVPSLTSGRHRGQMHEQQKDSTAPPSSSQQKLHGGSLAYTAPETFLVPESGDCSPYAPDMWALGCIMYALFAGRLPFMDTFEPRLQSKIMQGRWEMPERLKRRGEIRGKAGQMTSMDRTGSFSSFKEPSARLSLLHSVNVSPNVKSQMLNEPHDLSASMPSLPPRTERAHSITGLPTSSSGQSMVFADESAQSESATIDDVAEEQDPLSDAEDGTFDFAMDGRSKERCAARRVLRGLLQVDASKRWTIRELASSEWIRGQLEVHDVQDDLDKFPSRSDEQQKDELERNDRRADRDLPSSLLSELTRSTMQAHSQDTAGVSARQSAMGSVEKAPLDNEEMAEGDEVGPIAFEQDYTRGRARHRGGPIEPIGPSTRAKPIDIDRSKSRSRSRVRGGSPTWTGEEAFRGGYSWRQQQQHDEHQYQRQHQHQHQHQHQYQQETRDDDTSDRSVHVRNPSIGRPSLGGRSSSVDIYARRGRASSKTADGGGLGARGHNSRSRSRSRRTDLDLIMPQLSLNRAVTGGQAKDDRLSTPGESREASPALTTADESAVSRASIWKSPMRARDRLASLVSGSSGGSGGSKNDSTLARHSSTNISEDESSDGARKAESAEKDKLWWQRGRSSRKTEGNSTS